MSTYVVWVGGVEVGAHRCKEAADVTAASWRDDGYDDVAISIEEAGYAR